MRLRFIGTYTGGRKSITYLECTFEGHEPREVPSDVAKMLSGHPEFEPCDDEAEKGELSELRAAYAEKMGKKPYHGWDADELVKRMA